MGAGLFDLFTTRKAQERTLRPNDCVYPEPFDYAQDKRSRWAQGDAPLRASPAPTAPTRMVQDVSLNKKFLS